MYFQGHKFYQQYRFLRDQNNHAMIGNIPLYPKFLFHIFIRNVSNHCSCFKSQKYGIFIQYVVRIFMDGIKYSVDVISHDVWDIGIGVINPFSISP